MKEPQEVKEKLTTKQRRFIEEYCIDFNATQAAIRAGYNPKSAKTTGAENLTKPYILGEIATFLDRLSMKPEESIKRLSDIGRGSFATFLRISEAGLEIDLNSDEAKRNFHLIKKVKQSKRTTRQDGIKTETVFFEIELHDSKDAIKTLLEVYGKISPKDEEVIVNVVF